MANGHAVLFGQTVISVSWIIIWYNITGDTGNVSNALVRVSSHDDEERLNAVWTHVRRLEYSCSLFETL